MLDECFLVILLVIFVLRKYQIVTHSLRAGFIPFVRVMVWVAATKPIIFEASDENRNASNIEDNDD